MRRIEKLADFEEQVFICVATILGLFLLCVLGVFLALGVITLVLWTLAAL